VARRFQCCKVDATVLRDGASWRVESNRAPAFDLRNSQKVTNIDFPLQRCILSGRGKEICLLSTRDHLLPHDAKLAGFHRLGVHPDEVLS
jgi:hypothetical protein